MRNLSSTEQLILTCTSVLILFTTALTWLASPPFREQTTAVFTATGLINAAPESNPTPFALPTDATSINTETCDEHVQTQATSALKNATYYCYITKPGSIAPLELAETLRNDGYQLHLIAPGNASSLQRWHRHPDTITIIDTHPETKGHYTLTTIYHSQANPTSSH